MILDYNYILDGTTTSPLAGISISTASGSTQVSTNVIDLANARDLGVGDEAGATPKIMCLVTQTFTAATGTATINIKAQGSTDNTTFTTYAESGELTTAALQAGKVVARFDWPAVQPDTGSLPRYLRLAYTANLGLMSTGKVISAIVLGRDDPTAYPPGITVSN